MPARITTTAKTESLCQQDWRKAAITHRYRYVDASGELVQEAVRKACADGCEGGPQKRFAQAYYVGTRRFSGEGAKDEAIAHGWKPVLYRLPRLLEAVANCEPIWVCEGEKDADRAVEEAGVAATTNASGALGGEKEWPELLRAGGGGSSD